MCYPGKSERIPNDISEQIRVMGDRHRHEQVSSIDRDDQNLAKNDDFHVTEFWSKLMDRKEFRLLC
jgi:hypothetical protein